MVKPKIPYITGFRKIGGKAIFAKFSKKLYSYILLKTSGVGVGQKKPRLGTGARDAS